MKRIIGICFLALTMLLNSSFVLAADDEGSTSNLTDSQRETISLLNSLGIFDELGEEDAEGNITRAEFAEIAVRVVGGDDQLSESPRRIYVDVLPEDEGAASIEYLYNSGLMLGYENAEFKPQELIKVEEAATVLVKALGYTNWAEYDGGWVDGYYSIALKEGLLDGVEGTRGEAITYTDLAIMVRNTLECREFVIKNGFEQGLPVEETQTGTAYMSYALNIYMYTGIVDGVGETSLSDADTEFRSDMCSIDGEMFNMGEVDMTPYLGMRVKVYYLAENYDYTVLFVTEDRNSNNVVEIAADDINSATTSSVNYVSGTRDRIADISSDAIFIYNGKRLETVSDLDLMIGDGSLKLISNDGNDRADVVVITEYKTYIVSKAVVTDYILHFKYDAPSLDLSGDEYTVKYYMDGEEAEFANITTNSVLSIAMSKNLTGNILVNVYISNNKVEGTVTRVESVGKTKLAALEDGTEYYFTSEYMSRLESGQGNTYEPTPGVAGTLYIDYFGKLAAYMTGGTGKNYAYVVKCWYDENEEKGQIRLFTKDGEFIDLALVDDVSMNGSRVSPANVRGQLEKTGEGGEVYQLIIYNSNSDEEITSIETAVDMTLETAQNGYYIAQEDEFVLNYVRATGAMRFYKNMAEHLPFCYVDGETIQFMVPADKTDEKNYSVLTKPETTDVAFPGPIYIYDAKESGRIGALVTNTKASNRYETPVVINNVYEGIDEDGEVCTGLEFANGTKMLINSDASIEPVTGGRWEEATDYDGYTFKDLKRGDVIEYITDGSNNIDKLRIVVKSDNIGGLRLNGTDQEWIQRSGNMVAEVISVADSRTALVKYSYQKGGNMIYQTMLVNGPTYRYDSTENMVYNSSMADLMPGDIVLINSFWWSPNLVVIFR